MGEGYSHAVTALQEGAWEMSTQASFSTCPLYPRPPAPPSQKPKGKGDH